MLSRRAARSFLLTCVLLLVSAAPASAVEVAIDQSYGVGGVATVDFVVGPIVASGDDEVADAVIQPDGRLVLAGSRERHYSIFGVPRHDNDAAFARLLPDGSLDPSFSGDGRVLSSIADKITSVALQADGGIVAAGSGGDLYANLTGVSALMRLLPDGSPDRSFGVNGSLIDAEVGPARDVAIDGEGRIVVLHSDLVVSRYLAGGSLDPSFGDAGRFRHGDSNYLLASELPFGCITLSACDKGALAILQDGSIVVGDFRGVERDPNYESLVFKLTGDGWRDPSFSDGGDAVIPFSEAAFAVDLDVQNDGSLLVTSVYGYSSEKGVGLARLNSSGHPDPTFGDGGVVEVVLENDYSADTVVEPDGHITALVGGHQDDPILVRLQADGAPDESFGPGGIRLVGVPGSPLHTNRIELHDEHLYILGSIRTPGSGYHFDFMSFRLTWQADPLPKCTITGTEEADVLQGTAGDDVICGLGGGDVLVGHGGADTLIGGDGNDFLHAKDLEVNDVIDGGAGRDQCRYDEGDVLLDCP